MEQILEADVSALVLGAKVSVEDLSDALKDETDSEAETGIFKFFLDFV